MGTIIGLTSQTLMCRSFFLASHPPATEPSKSCYQAGVDLHENDRLGTLGLTLEGLAARDRFVFECCRDAGIPVVATMGGGYGRDLDVTIEAHCNTIRELKAAFEAA